MGCKGIMSELNSTLFDCYVRNRTQKATPFSCDYLRNQIKPRLIMTYNFKSSFQNFAGKKLSLISEFIPGVPIHVCILEN